MDQTEELARLKAELAELRLSFNRRNAQPTSTAGHSAATSTYVPDASRSASTGQPSAGLTGSKYAKPTESCLSSQPAQGARAPSERVTGASDNANPAIPPAQNASPFRASSNVVSSRGISSGDTATNSMGSLPTASKRSKKSLLGQEYMPPSKEKIARCTAVKMIPANTPAPTLKTADQPPLPEKPPGNAKENGSLVDSNTKSVKRQDEAAKQAEVKDQARLAGEQAEEDTHHRAEEGPKDDAAKAKDELPVGDVTTNNHQSDQKYFIKELPTGTDAPATEPKDFFANSGRRICISNLPAGADGKDIQELIEKKANLGHCVEKITVFRRANGRPGCALVDVADSKDASHIVKWMNDEHLFGWPITLRLARDLSKVAIDELVNNDLATVVPESEAPDVYKAGSSSMTCRYWHQGHCRNSVNCKFAHSSDGNGTLLSSKMSRNQSTMRRPGHVGSKRAYNFSNIPLPADGGDDSGSSIFGTSVYRPTALRIITDEP